jgi:kinesin family protein 11
MQSSAAVSVQLENILLLEREQAAVNRRNLLSQITDLVTNQGTAQDQRLEERISEL